jgi:hypothetical protein
MKTIATIILLTLINISMFSQQGEYLLWNGYSGSVKTDTVGNSVFYDCKFKTGIGFTYYCSYTENSYGNLHGIVKLKLRNDNRFVNPGLSCAGSIDITMTFVNGVPNGKTIIDNSIQYYIYDMFTKRWKLFNTDSEYGVKIIDFINGVPQKLNRFLVNDVTTKETDNVYIQFNSEGYYVAKNTSISYGYILTKYEPFKIYKKSISREYINNLVYVTEYNSICWRLFRNLKYPSIPVILPKFRY